MPGDFHFISDRISCHNIVHNVEFIIKTTNIDLSSWHFPLLTKQNYNFLPTNFPPFQPNYTYYKLLGFIYMYTIPSPIDIMHEHDIHLEVIFFFLFFSFNMLTTHQFSLKTFEVSWLVFKFYVFFSLYFIFHYFQIALKLPLNLLSER